MVIHFPIDGEQVARAAEETIAQHGDSALVEADKQIRTCESEGINNVAETWKLIREVIRDTQQSDTTAERYEKALNKGGGSVGMKPKGPLRCHKGIKVTGSDL